MDFANLSDDTLAEVLWDHMHLREPLRPCELILALGSNDLRVAEHAARLYHQGLAPRLMFSGGLGRLTEGSFARSEAETFAARALEMGVPAEALLLEPRSTNTGENIQFSRAVLAEHGLDPQTFIVVQKPYMERRARATFRRQWPGKEILMASPPLSWQDYPTEEIPRSLVLSVLVGDVQRMRLYAEKGFQEPDPPPAHVWAAMEELARRGYDSHCVR